MIGLINYGSGNIYAISNIYKKLNVPHYIANTPGELERADKLILPGVGDFDETMTLLSKSGMEDKLDEYVLVKKVPILGVCVGMQIMGESSEEGKLPGFGWIKGKIKRIDDSKLDHKPHLPHMGWNTINPKKDTELFSGIDRSKGFYFLHSYYFSCERSEDILSVTNYGTEFSSSVNHENVFGVQFHPEKSHGNGIKIFENYANL